MDKALWQALKSRDQEKRRNAICRLEDDRSHEAAAALKHIAAGGRRRWFSKFGFDDQIVALETLLRTESPASIAYVRDFLTERVSTAVSGYEDGNGDALWQYDLHACPQASGEFGKRLLFTVTYEERRWGDGERLAVDHYYSHAGGDAWREYKMVPRDEAAHAERARLLEQIARLGAGEATPESGQPTEHSA